MEYISVVFLTIFFSSGTNTQKKHTLSGEKHAVDVSCHHHGIIPRMIWEEKQTGF